MMLLFLDIKNVIHDIVANNMIASVDQLNSKVCSCVLSLYQGRKAYFTHTRVSQ